MAGNVNSRPDINDTSSNESIYVVEGGGSGQHEGGSQSTGYNTETYTPVAFDYQPTVTINPSRGYSTDSGTTWSGAPIGAGTGGSESIPSALSGAMSAARNMNKGLLASSVEGGSNPTRSRMAVTGVTPTTSTTAKTADVTTDVDTSKTTRRSASSVPAAVSSSDVYATGVSTKPKVKESGKVIEPEVVASEEEVMVPTESAKAVKEKKKSGRPKNAKSPRSRIAEAQRKMDREAADGRKTVYVSPSDLMGSIKSYTPRLVEQNRQRRRAIIEDNLDRKSLAKSLEKWTEPEEGEESYYDYLLRQQTDLADERRAIQATENAVPNRGNNSEEWNLNQPIYLREEDINNPEKQLEVLRGYQTERTDSVLRLFQEYEDIKDDSLFEDDNEGIAPRHQDWNKVRSEVNDMLAKARDTTRRMLLNPLLLHIEGEHVVTKTERVGTKNILKGHVAYSESVNQAIRNIRELYGGCQIRDVLELVMLRAGLGVDVNQKIGGVDASKFVLSERQIIELLSDIEASQLKYGHPFGLVQGTPKGSGVRDDSGKFVVVAGTRCYPMGYCPAGLFRSLSSSLSSELYKAYKGDLGRFQRDVGNKWINETYPELLRQTKGNAMWQARAIENMMRAVMSMDGIDPSNLRIPEVQVNQSLMQMAVERSNEDSAIGRANEVRQKRERDANEEFLRRNRKSNGKRRRWGGGDVIRGVSTLEKAAKVSDVFLLITGPIEALQAMTEANVAEAFMGKWTESRLRNAGIDPETYSVTERLSAVAESRETVEARSVAESLYRIGGWTAIDAFIGNSDYKLTKSDLRRFLDDTLYTNPERFGAREGQVQGFLANARAVMDGLESAMLGSDLFKTSESKQFVKLSMNEMAQASLHDRESFTSDDVEQWSEAGGAEMVRSLLRTDAGREAFMSQGITSLGRKSPMDHAVRQVLSRNGVTEFAVRTFFDRFPEYGMNKIMRQVPYSNTISYLLSYAIDGLGKMMQVMGGDLETAGEALDRVGDYQVGRRLSLREGLMKNLMYDTIMGANKLVIGCVYFGVLQLLGGLHRPPLPEDRLTWYEWVLGDEEESLPIKWAWFMDDLSGIGLPLGTALAIAQSGDWSNEAKREAADVFLNAIADFNDGTAIFDAIHLINNFDEEMADALGTGESWLSPTLDERRQTSLELMAWKFLGDMTPTIVKQILPWSRDYLFREDYYARSASKVYDTPNYTMDDAKSQYRTKSVTDYKEYEYRKMAQNNPIMALILDLTRGAGFMSDNEDRSAKTGYMFTEQPIRTKTVDRFSSAFERFQVSPDELVGYNGDEARAEFWRQHSEEVCQYITSHFENSSDAIKDGFMLDPETRTACQEYCYWMINVKIPQNLEDEKDRIRDQLGLASGARIPQQQYDDINETANSEKQRYRALLDNYFENSDIPWRIPRYAILDSDVAIRRVDDNGNAAVDATMAGDHTFNLIRQALGLGQATPATDTEQYLYGNIPNSLPVYSPNRMPLVPTPQEYMAMTKGGRIPDIDPYPEMRGMEKFEPTMPNAFKTYYDPEQASSMLGFDATSKSKPTTQDTTSKTSSSGTPYSYGTRRRYSSGGGGGRGYYSSGGSYRSSGGGYSSSYNPKIYSTPKQVNSDRASGMQVRQPYKATNTYLHPNFYTKGSREAYKRSDI